MALSPPNATRVVRFNASNNTANPTNTYVPRTDRSCCHRLAGTSPIPFAERVTHPFVSAVPRAIELHDLSCQPHGRYDSPVMHNYYLFDDRASYWVELCCACGFWSRPVYSLICCLRRVNTKRETTLPCPTHRPIDVETHHRVSFALNAWLRPLI